MPRPDRGAIIKADRASTSSSPLKCSPRASCAPRRGPWFLPPAGTTTHAATTCKVPHMRVGCFQNRVNHGAGAGHRVAEQAHALRPTGMGGPRSRCGCCQSAGRGGSYSVSSAAGNRPSTIVPCRLRSVHQLLHVVCKHQLVKTAVISSVIT